LNIKSIEKQNLLIHTKNNFHNLFGQRATIIQCILNDYYKNNFLDIKLLKEKLNNTLLEVKQTKEIDFDFGINNLMHSFALAGFNICIDPAILKMNNLRNTAFIDIVRECATNSLSHAKANVLNVQLTDKQTILIHDDKHLKLESLKESTGLDSIRLNANNLNLKVQFLFKDGFTIKLFSEHK